MSPALLLLCLVFPGLVSPFKIPSFWKICKRSDPKVAECMKQSAQSIINKLGNGSRDLEVMPIEPFRFDRMEANQGKGNIVVNLTFFDLDVYGLTKTVIDRVHWDWEKQHLETWLRFLEPMRLIGKYTVKGKILLLPIVGKGDSNITAVTNGVKLDLWGKMVKKNGKEVVQFTDSQMDLNATRLYVRLENLFNGDKLLSDQMNKFLDENWELVLEDMGRTVFNALSQGIAAVINNVFSKQTVQQLFPEK